MAGEQGQATAGTPQEGVNQGGATLDAAVAAELELLEQGDADGEGSQGDNPNDQADDGDGSDEQDGDDEGDDTDGTDPDEADDAPAGELVEYQLESGKKVKVDPEIVPYLMKDADYRQKTAQIADFGRHLQGREQQVNQLFQAGQHFVQARARLEAVDSAGREIVQALSADPNMYETDFVRFGQLTGRLQMLQMQRQGIVGRATQAEQQHSQYQEQQRQQRIAQARPALASVGLTGERLGKVAEYAIRSGATPEEMEYLNGGGNPALLLTFDKARLYDELMAKQGQITKQVREAKPIRQVARPGSASQGNQSGARETLGKRLKSSGSYSDAVALELAHMQRPPSRRSR